MLLIELSSTVLSITCQIVVFTLSVHLDTFKSQDLIACCSWAPQDSRRDAGSTHQPHQRKIRCVFFQKRAIDMQTAVVPAGHSTLQSVTIDPALGGRNSFPLRSRGPAPPRYDEACGWVPNFLTQSSHSTSLCAFMYSSGILSATE